MHVLYAIHRRRCDVPMRRQKEKCNTPFYKKWECSGECKRCICCIITLEDGTEEHVSLISQRKYKE